MNSSMLLFLNILFSILIQPLLGVNPSTPAPSHSLTQDFLADLPRTVISLFTPYTHSEDITSTTICKKFSGWRPTSEGWNSMLNPRELTLCSKDFGGGGNCMYYAIAGALKDSGFQMNRFNLSRDDIPPGIKLSLAKAALGDAEGYFQMKDIRLLASILYIGIDPRVQEAIPHFDREKLKTKVENTVVGLRDAHDIAWNPRECLGHLKNGTRDPLELAKDIFGKLISTEPVHSWGSGDDLYGLAELLNVDFLLFHDDEHRIQHVMSSHKCPICTINMYYYSMVHFQAAGIVKFVQNGYEWKLNSVYNKFELDEGLYDIIFTHKT